MKQSRNDMRQKRHQRSRFYLAGTGSRPRLAVFRSLKHIYAQVINDDTGETLATASSLDKDIRSSVNGGNKTGAKAVGERVAKKAIEKGISTVVFDKGGYKYHGRVKELADGARAGGLLF